MKYFPTSFSFSFQFVSNKISHPPLKSNMEPKLGNPIIFRFHSFNFGGCTGRTLPPIAPWWPVENGWKSPIVRWLSTMILGDLKNLVTSLNLLILAYRIYYIYIYISSTQCQRSLCWSLRCGGGGYLSHRPFHTGTAHATTRWTHPNSLGHHLGDRWRKMCRSNGNC